MKQQRRKPPPKDWSRTFQLRLHGEYPALDGMAVRYGDAKRNTFAQVYRTGSSFDDILNNNNQTITMDEVAATRYKEAADTIKAARGAEDLSSELTMHYGLLPRANRGIFAINDPAALGGTPVPGAAGCAVFNAPNFRNGATTDKFFLCLEALDPKFDLAETKAYLQKFSPNSVVEVEY